MKKYIIYTIILLFLFSKIVCAKEYRRIISLAPSITKTLYELGVEELVKGITIYCPYGTIKKEVIGTILEPNIERIALLNPDLIISTKEGNLEKSIEKLYRLGFEIYVMKSAKNFNDICINYCSLAKKLNKIKTAKKITTSAKNSINKLYKKLNNINSLKLFWEIGSAPLYTAGKNNFLNDYNYYSKTTNIYLNTKKSYFPIDIEDVVKRNPDIILIANMGRISNEEKKTWGKYKMINAVKSNKIFILDFNYMLIPTPVTFAESLKILVKTIYGDRFNAH
ncbi:MAG: helical backbone metal receptor [Endomicrobium sp.]|jgi:iron complex transport system substrate-binding protein|nr:helical backbone metal receptor [Endomicrobium sp.]